MYVEERSLDKRIVGEVYLCNNYNWDGTCSYIVEPLDTCINLGSDWDSQIRSFSPDSGVWYCTLYENTGCTGTSVQYSYPGTESLGQTNTASIECTGGILYEGDMTYYDVGLGSCGYTNVASDSIVALSYVMMNNPANPNNNSLYGKQIAIVYEDVTHYAEVVDTCEGCAVWDIDLSTSLFAAVAPDGDGRVHDVQWYFT